MSRLSKELICDYIEDIKSRIIVYDVIDSTNSEAKRLAISGEGDVVIIADCQTEGRGRLGRSFYSPKGNGLYMSFLIKSDFPDEKSVLLTTATSVIVCRAIEDTANIYPQIKWVNDLYLDGKKVCGILAEAIRNKDNNAIEYIIIGIGINCEGEDFPEDLKDIAGTLGGVDRNRLAAAVIKGMKNIRTMIADNDFIDQYKKRSLVIGEKINVLNSEIGEAEAIDIDERGGLVIRTRDGKTKTLSSGEISIRLSGNNNSDN